MAVDRITYVSSDGELFTVNPDGTGLLKLAGASQLWLGPGGPLMAQPLEVNNFYTWPTWAPDGTMVAASRVQVSGGQVNVSVQVIAAASGRSETVYKNEVPAMVVDGAPHYLYWSPDSKALAFLATTPQGLTLFIADMQSKAQPLGVLSGAPLYFQWSGDGNSILVHVGEELKLLRKPFGSAPQPLPPGGQGFRSPALSRDGKEMVHVEADGSRQALLITETTGSGGSRQVLDVGPLSAFAWSSGEKLLAVADRQDDSSPAFERLRLVGAGGGPARTLEEGPIMAFYWSPAGDKIAWVRLDPEQRQFVWVVAAVVGGEPREVFRFQPSGDVLTMLSFFDQYANSHTPWSPDGSRLVVAGVQGQPMGSRNGQTATGDRVFVVAVDGATGPRELASGSLAFWSWN